MGDLYKLHKVLDHLGDVYGFELVPCSIPRNQFQYLKLNFYLWVKSKVSGRLFYFLRDRVSPIRYLDERPNKEIWLSYRSETGHVEFEIDIRRMPPHSFIYISDSKGIFKISGDNYIVKLYTRLIDCKNISFPMNLYTGIESINAYLSDFPVFKQKLREYRLNNILK